MSVPLAIGLLKDHGYKALITLALKVTNPDHLFL